MGSERLVDEHSTKWPAKSILKQRQQLRALPVSEVAYQWKEQSSRFWVCGHDHKVYAPDYPQRSAAAAAVFCRTALRMSNQ
ncbi:protein SSUH2 homolog [Stylophora pistillata]|uniref:protein SSUH2 homolog n=1 Tax=Stylophora pistillata TaxID=50429 RepID=UPI000C04FBD5|nr:protein SSUH2 homolog [Stylophora pistillata]